MHYNKIFKHLKIGIHGWAAAAIVVCATVLRVVLVGLNWPITNSDESTMGLMALHIVQRGEHPIFFYGQHYMGSLEAFMAAGFFNIFGPSIFALRLVTVLLFAFTLICLYLLVSLLYSKNFALVTLLLLSAGSRWMIGQEVFAIGGYAEILAFSTLLLLLSSWLALTSNREIHQPWWRALAFFSWGLTAGLGLWSDLLIAPFVIVAGLLLLAGCLREWRTLAIPAIALGLIIGAFPLIYYNLHALPGEDSLSVLLAIHNVDAIYHPQFIDQLKGAFIISLPIITGLNPDCKIKDGPPATFDDPHPFRCFVEYTGWGGGYTLLWLVAAVMVLVALWRLRPRSRPQLPEDRQQWMRQFARLMLLGGAGLTMLSYVSSPNSATWPQTNDRYLLGLLIAIPAVLWPLWGGALTATRVARLLAAAKGTVLLVVGLVLLAGTVRIFVYDIPNAQLDKQRRVAFIQYLAHKDIKHIYTDYWTCDRIAFESDEKVICSVVDSGNRYHPYFDAVKADPHASYAFKTGTPQADAKAAEPAGRYQHFSADGYEIFIPR